MIVTVWPFPTHKRMIVCTVHEPPTPPVDRIDRAEAMMFLKDGFNWGAFLFGPLWLLANRLWLATLGYLAVAIFAYVLFEATGVAEALFGPLLVALNAVVGFEAHWLKSAKLEAKGWNTLGSVTGQGIADCERRFFEGWLPSQSPLRRQPRAEQSDARPVDGNTVQAAPAEKPKRGLSSFFRRSREG